MAKKLVKGVEEELTCPVCLGRFIDPRVLPCQHTYCRSCIERLIARASPEKTVVACPTCREEHPLPEGGAAGFVTNFSFKNLLELLENHTLYYERAKRLHCENGLDENVAVAQCLDCNIHLCNDCWKVHRKMVATRNHQTASHEELRKSGEKLVNVLKPRYCPEHKNQVLRLYCETCFKPICGDCTITDHHNHKYMFLKEKEAEKEQVITPYPVEMWPGYEAVTTHIHGLGKDAKSETQHHQATIQTVKRNPDPLPPPLPPQHPSQDSKDFFVKRSAGKASTKPSAISRPAYIDILLPLEDQPWYHGSITRAEAEEILAEQPDGSFLVRNSESRTTGYSLSVQLSAAKRDIRHLRIEYMYKDRKYTFGETGKTFRTVPEGIDLYTTKHLNVRGSEHSTLKYPVPRLYDLVKS